MRLIHRAGFFGGTLCEQSGGVSVSGAIVNCPACLKLSQEVTKEEAWNFIKLAAQRYRDSRA